MIHVCTYIYIYIHTCTYIHIEIVQRCSHADSNIPHTLSSNMIIITIIIIIIIIIDIMYNISIICATISCMIIIIGIIGIITIIINPHVHRLGSGRPRGSHPGASREFTKKGLSRGGLAMYASPLCDCNTLGSVFNVQIENMPNC